jgi:hypothetical protein
MRPTAQSEKPERSDPDPPEFEEDAAEATSGVRVMRSAPVRAVGGRRLRKAYGLRLNVRSENE